jgi:hypothetical protein
LSVNQDGTARAGSSWYEDARFRLDAELEVRLLGVALSPEQWEVEADAIDELATNPEFDGKAPYAPRGNEGRFELDGAHRFHADRAALVAQGVFPLLARAQRPGVGQCTVRLDR